MPSFKFVCEHRNPWDETLDIRNTTECEYEQLSDVIGAFQDFLRGCGYVFDGTLDIIEDTTIEETAGCGNNCEGCECEKPSARSPEWNWTVNQLMKGPTTLQDVTKEDTITFSDTDITLGEYGAACESISVSPGIDTITITGGGFATESSKKESCELCGLPKSVMKGHNCWDDNCPKGSW